MNMSIEAKSGVKITSLEVENVKRVRAFGLNCDGKSLTIIGGRNGQGKTSVLDAIMWALGGDRHKPTNPVRNGSDRMHIKVELDNGVSVERNGATGSLKVTSATGKGGQALLNEFVSQFALDLPKFMASKSSDKAQALLDAFPGIGDEIRRLNSSIATKFTERTVIGRVADQKGKYAKELPFDPEAPEAPLSGSEMTKRMQECLTQNARNQSLRQDAARADQKLQDVQLRQTQAEKRVAICKATLEAAEADLTRVTTEVVNAKTAVVASRATAAQLQDADTTAIEAELEQIDAINARVRSNESRLNAIAEAEVAAESYAQITAEIEVMRAERLTLLASVAMPLEGLSVNEEGELIYHDAKWDCMSGSEQLRVAAAIAAAMKPECGFVLLDRLEAMDAETLHEFGEWLEERGLQAIGTRVGVGEETSIVIEDGVSRGVDAPPAAPYSFD